MNVLLVGQDADLLNILAYTLRRHGFVPHTADSEASALLRQRAVCPAVLIIDNGGLAPSGLATLWRLHAVHALPYIWLTPHGDDEPAHLVPGCIAVLQKPFRLNDLIGALHSV